MNVKLFQKIAAVLLERHYGLELNDTNLHDDEVVAECIEQGYRPYQIVAEHAEQAGLDRIDISGCYGVPSQAPITAGDEDALTENL